MAEKKVETTGLLGRIDVRFPASEPWKAHLSEYYASKNFNFWYFFGSLALLVLMVQVATGIFLVMNYKPDGTLSAVDTLVAHASVEFITREVPWGWLMRYMHPTSASVFFIVVRLYIFRGILYGSYREPRELIWVFGCLIFLCLMTEAFMGYLLPWGQTPYWDAQMVMNLFLTAPLTGPGLSLWIRGDYVVPDVTLNHFFSFHVIAVPLVLLGLMMAHIIALHEMGSNNPDGVEIKARKDEHGTPSNGILFHSYYPMHDIAGVTVFLPIFNTTVLLASEAGGYFLKASNFTPTDSLRMPPHIIPVWYFTSFYSVLRTATSDFLPWLWGFIAIMLGLLFVCPKSMKVKGMAVAVAAVLALDFVFIDVKFWDVVVMGGPVVIFFFSPWLDQSPVRSIHYCPGFHKTLLVFFMIALAVLGYLGIQPPNPVGPIILQVGIILYFAFFLMMSIWNQIGTFKPALERITSTSR